MSKKPEQQEKPQEEAKATDALQMLVTLFTIYQLREHRGETNE